MPIKDQEARRRYNMEYHKKHYEKHKGAYKEKAKAFNKSQRKWNREFISRVKSMRGCIDCGIDNPIVLDFDHVTGQKLGNISDMVNNACGLAKIKKEIRKCEVRCANCHRLRTHKRRKS